MATQALSQTLPKRRVAIARDSQLSWRHWDTLEAAQADWLALEQNAVLTPYQRYDWCAQYLKSGFASDATVKVLVLRDKECPIALMPLEITSRFGIRTARLIGMPISNADSLIFDPAHGERISAEVIAEAFSTLREGGVRVDLVSFHCFLDAWQGVRNPLMDLPHAIAPNHLYLTALAPGDKPYIEQALPHKRRTNVRRSRRRLGEQFGELSLVRARTEDEARALYAVFLDQRGRRFVEMGVENVFARPTFQRQLLDGAIASLEKDDAAVTIHALKANDTVLAISIGVRSPGHYSQYINSTTYGEAAKYSLMGVLMSMLVDELRTEGVTSLDMGLGDFDYKTDWTQRHEVYDAVMAVSPLGHLVAPVLRLARRAKRAIKQNRTIWMLAKPLVALKARLSR